MINKKGFLLGEETVKIIIALIAIIFLIYLLASLYYSSKDKKDLELAKASLEYFVGEMNSGKTQAEIYNPGGWHLVSWPYSGIMPKSCSSLGWDSCVCICKDINVFVKFWIAITPWNTMIQNTADKCDDDGICKFSSKEVVVGSSTATHPIEIDPPLALKIDHQSNKIIITKR